MSLAAGIYLYWLFNADKLIVLMRPSRGSIFTERFSSLLAINKTREISPSPQVECALLLANVEKSLANAGHERLSASASHDIYMRTEHVWLGRENQGNTSKQQVIMMLLAEKYEVNCDVIMYSSVDSALFTATPTKLTSK